MRTAVLSPLAAFSPFLLAVAGAGANPPAMITSGQDAVLWEDTEERLHFTIRNNLHKPSLVHYTLEGPGVLLQDEIFLPARHQDSLGYDVPPLQRGAHEFQLTLWDTSADPDSLFWSATSHVRIVDSLWAPQIIPRYDPFVIPGTDPESYDSVDKVIVIKIPKEHGFVPFYARWRIRLGNPDPARPSDLFGASPQEGEFSGGPGEEILVTTTLEAEAPVPFGTMNDVGFLLVTGRGDTLFQVSTPVVGDSSAAYTPEVGTGVGEASGEESTWGRLKSLLR